MNLRCQDKKRIVLRKRLRYFTKTVIPVFGLAALTAVAAGLLLRFCVMNDRFTFRYVATQEGLSGGPIYAVDDKKEEWNLILANKWNPIPDEYDLNLTQLSTGQSVDTRICPELQEMFEAARRNSVYLVVAAGYRTAEMQQRLLDEKIAEFKAQGLCADDAEREAKTWVAIPGTSEHQLGIAVDINADGTHSTGREVYKWLHNNAWKYGFILRYPSDKTAITGCGYEPWHYRYVGKEAAGVIYRRDLCLEEYLNACYWGSK